MRRQSKAAVEKLISQFSALAEIHESMVERTEGDPRSISINVEIADTSMIFRQMDERSSDNDFLTAANGERGHRFEFMWPIVTHPSFCFNGKPLVIESRVGLHPIREALIQLRSDMPSYIVWATRCVWFKDPGEEAEGLGIIFGEPAGWDISYTVYLPPRQDGFLWLLHNANLTSNVGLTDGALVNGVIAGDDAYNRVADHLEVIACEFEDEVYKKGLAEIIMASKRRGMSGYFSRVEMKSWFMCGRITIMLEAPNQRNPGLRDSFTLIGDASLDKPKFGWRSICATVDRARELVRAVSAGWAVIPEDKRGERYRDSKE
jgi:hypothetical protein